MHKSCFCPVLNYAGGSGAVADRHVLQSTDLSCFLNVHEMNVAKWEGSHIRWGKMLWLLKRFIGMPVTKHTYKYFDCHCSVCFPWASVLNLNYSLRSVYRIKKKFPCWLSYFKLLLIKHDQDKWWEEFILFIYFWRWCNPTLTGHH